MEELILKADENDLVSMLNSEAGLNLPLPFEQDIFLYGTEIAGTRYKENIAELYEKLNEGDLVSLIREPENPYDEYAIRIEVDLDGKPGFSPNEHAPDDLTWKLGYVPRAFNKIFARLMDAGKLLYGTVRHKEMDHGYYRIVVKIYMKE